MPVSIMLDAGHGGRDPGAVYNGRQEKDDVLKLVLAIGEILQNSGIDVEYTRTTDIYETPFQKAMEANEAGVDFFISIHRNSSPLANQYMGVESLIYNLSGIKYEMAENINAQLETVGFRDLGVKARPNLVVLRRTKMPAILVEVGFINSDSDNALFDKNFGDIAQAIADGILDTLEEKGLWKPEGARSSSTASEAGRISSDADTSATVSPADASPADGSVRSDDRTPANSGTNSETSSTPDSARTNPSDENTDSEFPDSSHKNASDENSNSEFPTTSDSIDHTRSDTNSVPPASSGNRSASPSVTYSVQVGAFRNPAYARRLLNELTEMDFPARIDDSSQYDRVLVGQFDVLNDAAMMERRLKQSGYPTVIISFSEEV